MTNYSNTFPPSSLAPGDSVYLFGVLANVAISALTRTNSTVLCTTSVAHNFVPGQRVRILQTSSTLYGANTDQAAIYGFDGEYTILTTPSTTTFTYTDLQKPNDTGTGGNAQSIQAENPVAGQASQRVALVLEQFSPAPGLTFDFWITASPGSGVIVIQEAIDDVDSGYVTPANAAYTITLGAAQYYSSDLIPFGERFSRVKVTTALGAGNLVAKVNRVQ